MAEALRDYVLLFSCVDRIGIVAAVAQTIAVNGCNIRESAQYGDEASGRFFMRVAFAAPGTLAHHDLTRAFAPVAERYGFDWQLFDLSHRPRVLIMVSGMGHCLNDLLYRAAAGRLRMDIASIVSNHETWRRRAEHEGIAFHHLPVTPETKAVQEAALLALIEAQQVDLVILARYMQVLSDDLCRRLAGRVINIHHSFLPSFKGARPYHRAYERGVKMVGATAHYVTADLDEGPIIAQDVSVIDHGDSIDELISQGQDTESRVLSRAVRFHIEHRVLLNGSRTVVFK